MRLSKHKANKQTHPHKKDAEKENKAFTTYRQPAISSKSVGTSMHPPSQLPHDPHSESSF